MSIEEKKLFETLRELKTEYKGTPQGVWHVTDTNGNDYGHWDGHLADVALTVQPEDDATLIISAIVPQTVTNKARRKEACVKFNYVRKGICEPNEALGVLCSREHSIKPYHVVESTNAECALIVDGEPQ